MSTFKYGDAIRYKPGDGTYGYEDCVEADGRIPGTVVGEMGARVRVELKLPRDVKLTSVSPHSLVLEKDK